MGMHAALKKYRSGLAPSPFRKGGGLSGNLGANTGADYSKKVKVRGGLRADARAGVRAGRGGPAHQSASPGGGGGGHGKKGPGGGKYDPFATLTGKDLQREIAAATRLKYGDTQHELEGEGRASDMQQGRVNDWFNEYQSRLANLRAQTQGNYANTNAQVGQNIANASSQDAAQRGQLNQQAIQDAQLRGVNYTPGPDTAQQAASARQGIQTAYQNMLGSQGAANYSYLADKERIGAGEKVNQLLREAARGRDVKAKLLQLSKDKGDFGVTERASLRDADRKFYISKATIAAGNKRALISAKTSRSNNKRTTSTSAANNQRTTDTSTANNRRSTSTSRANKAATGRQQKRHDRRVAQAQKRHDRRTHRRHHN